MAGGLVVVVGSFPHGPLHELVWALSSTGTGFLLWP